MIFKLLLENVHLENIHNIIYRWFVCLLSRKPNLEELIRIVKFCVISRMYMYMYNTYKAYLLVLHKIL